MEWKNLINSTHIFLVLCLCCSVRFCEVVLDGGGGALLDLSCWILSSMPFCKALIHAWYITSESDCKICDLENDHKNVKNAFKQFFKINLLRRRDYFKAKSSIGIQNRFHFTQSQIFFHDWWELVSNTFSERIFSNQILKRRQKTRFLPIKQLIVLHVEPPSIPSLKGIASSFE